MKPVVIIGAGLSGLSCAIHLTRGQQKILLLEAKAAVGGRVATSQTATGFLIDEGFQVLLDSYPELRRVVSLEKLGLHCFNSGALIYDGKTLSALANPFRHPGAIGSTLAHASASLKDKALVVLLMLRAQLQSSDTPMGLISTLNYLRDFGFSKHFIESFWRPFLAGVYLDTDLSLGADFFKFLVRCFGWGRVCLPESGMRALPLQMAEQIPRENIRLNTSVASWTASEVVLESGEKIEASQVVCAGPPPRGGGTPSKEAFRSVTTYYFTSPLLSQLGWEKWLVLIPQELGFVISHMTLISSVVPAYSTSGKPLLSVSVIGKKPQELSAIIREVEQVAGRSLSLESVATVEVPRALPVISEQKSEGYEFRDGVIYCGDRWTSPSINGALKSGRLAAEFYLKQKAH